MRVSLSRHYNQQSSPFSWFTNFIQLHSFLGVSNDSANITAASPLSGTSMTLPALGHQMAHYSELVQSFSQLALLHCNHSTKVDASTILSHDFCRPGHNGSLFFDDKQPHTALTATRSLRCSNTLSRNCAHTKCRSPSTVV